MSDSERLDKYRSRLNLSPDCKVFFLSICILIHVCVFVCVCAASNQSGVMCRPADWLSGCRACWLPADGLHCFF